MAVADAFDAMTSDRPYRNGMQVEQALAIIAAEAGHQFDPAIVETFLRIMPKGKKGELT
jgi:HD-GYP domain-containing protein (c-di-GMP phosphodiesterase class II)